MPAPTFAACSGPAGNAGKIIYNAGYRTIEYCNGGAWVSTGGTGDTTSGLVGWWKLDDGAGTSATDSSGNGNTGTLSNGPTWTTGMQNGALNFNGTNQSVQIPYSSSLYISDDVTLSAWYNPSSSSGAVVDLGDDFGAGWGAKIIFNSGNSYFYIVTGGVAYAAAGPLLSTGTWYHLVGVRSGTNLYLYVNGLLAGTATAPTGPLRSVGQGAEIATEWGSQWAAGLIDDVRIYNRALSAADVMTLYTSTGGASGDIQTGLKGYWKLDETSGTTAADSSGGGNTGTLQGSPTWTTSGKINGALNSATAGDIVNVPTSATLQFSGAFSASVWLNTTGLSAAGQTWFIGNENYSGSTGWDLIDNGPYTASIIFRVFPSGDTAFSRSLVNDGVWHNIVGVYDGTNSKLYLDGTLMNTLSALWFTNNTYPYHIGYNGTGNSMLLDDARIYNRALSASDVLTLYNTGLTACASPVGYAGNMIYNNGTYHVLQYCDGVNWQPMGKVPGAGGGGCSNPVKAEGTIMYSSDYHVVQYCDGTTWNVAGGNQPITGLVGWWNLDEGSGTSAADSSGNNNTGTLQNTATWTTSGKINGALSLPNANDSVNIPTSASLQFSGAFSASLWLKTTGLSNASYTLLLGNEVWPTTGWLLLDNGPAGAYILFRFLPDGSFGGNCRSGSACFARGLVNDGVWHNIVGVYDGTTVRIYLDGVLKDTEAAGVFTNNTNPYAFGPTGGAAVLIDDARIYNRALSASEVWRLYNGAP